MMDNTDAESVERLLGRLERWSLARTNANVHANVIIAARYRFSRTSSHSFHGDSNEAKLVAAAASCDERIDSTPFDVSNWRTWRDALRQTVKLHPMLSAVVRNESSGRPGWGRLRSMDLTKIFHLVPSSYQTAQEGDDGNHEEEQEDTTQAIGDQEVEQWFEKEHKVQFDVTDKTVPLWRCRIIYNKSSSEVVVFWVFHHAISDGRSGFAFHQSLLDAVNERMRSKRPQHRSFDGSSSSSSSTSCSSGGSKSNQSTCRSNISASNAPLPPTLEQSYDVRPSWNFLLKMLFAELILPLWLSRVIGLNKPYFQGKARPTDEAAWNTDRLSQTNAKIVSIPRATTLLLKKAARRHGSSLTRLLKSALVLAMVDVMGLQGKTLKFSTPISMRKHLLPPVNNDVVGVFIASLDESTLISQRSAQGIWEVCELFHNNYHLPELVKQASEGVGVLSLLPSGDASKGSYYQFNTPWESYIREKATLGQSRLASIEFSNLGSWSPDSGNSPVPYCDCPPSLCMCSTMTKAFYPTQIYMSQTSGPLSALWCASAATVAGHLTVTMNWMHGSLQPAQAAGIINRFQTWLDHVVKEELDLEGKESL